LFDEAVDGHLRRTRQKHSNDFRAVLEAPWYRSPETEVIVVVGHEGSASVADRGPGVTASDRDQIFERFWRGQRKKAPGAGLGLAIVKEIMEVHGGSVEVTDNLGGGALFTLRFKAPRGKGKVVPRSIA
jgi:signal transduction histidine kinase